MLEYAFDGNLTGGVYTCWRSCFVPREILMTHIDFKKKISFARLRTSGSDIHHAFESDRGMIINSTPIRRLQQKTQVFPLERNSAVRSRLTHSLEVQQVGRSIVQSIFEQLSNGQMNEYGLTGLERAIESLVEVACLIHDMGTPPFGHCGEDAINRWFKENLPHLAPIKALYESHPDSMLEPIIHELIHFDGNAQAIRLVQSLHRFNLTYSQAASVLKYTRPGTGYKIQVPDDKNYLTKKVGFYITEKYYIDSMMLELEMAQYCRHPLSYIMEAADDISYSLADLEDAVEKRILSLETLKAHLEVTFHQLEPENRAIKAAETFQSVLNDIYQAAQYDEINPVHKFFIYLRVEMVQPLVKHAAHQFIHNIHQVYHGNLNRALLEDHSQFHALTETFKNIAFNYVFNNPEVETLELQGYKIIGGLLSEYRPLLELTQDEFQILVNKNGHNNSIERRFFNKLSRGHVAAYQLALKNNDVGITDTKLWEFYLRCRLLQDYVSGMTDQFAFDEYKILIVSN
nr:dGTPase [Candidatus Enterovibrio escacola]